MPSNRSLILSTDGIAFGNVQTMSTLPAASSAAGEVFFVSDAPGTALVVSDGTTWRPFARGVQGIKQAITSTDGTITVNFSPGFAAAPTIGVELQDVSGGQGTLTVKITALSTTSVSLQVNRMYNIAGILTLTTANTAGVIVHVTAVP